MIENLLSVFGSRERHSKRTKVKCMPLRTTSEALFVVCVNWATNRNWQTKVLDTRKVSQRNVLRKESVKLGLLYTAVFPPYCDRLVGLVVKALASRTTDLGSIPVFGGDPLF